MANKSERRMKASANKRAIKSRRMTQPGARSRYAKKKAYCSRHGVWGFEVPEPKPWK